MNHARVPSSVHGPPSMSCICRAVHHQPTAARTKSRAMSPSRARAAANAGASAALSAGSSAAAITSLGRPGELGREPRLPFVLDSERADARALRFRRGELRADRMEDADELCGLARLDPERDDVLDLEVDRVADANAVREAILDDLERRPLDTENLADQRRQPCHRPAQLAAVHGGELLRLLVGGPVVDEDADAPVALGHDLGRVGDEGELAAADIRSVDVTVADVEDEHDAAVVVRRSVVEREVARAHELARARLEVAAFQAPGHADLRFAGRDA